LLLVAGYYLDQDPKRQLILDGRTFSRQRQVQQVLDFCTAGKIQARFIECVCSEATARQRLERAVQASSHLASNRNFSLYHQLKALAEPIQFSHLVVNTEADLHTCLQQCLGYLGESSIGSVG
jgi:hypothetical protein